MKIRAMTAWLWNSSHDILGAPGPSAAADETWVRTSLHGRSTRVQAAGASLIAVALLFAAAGCNHLPGKPGDRSETLRPDQTLGFNVLYKSNCSACHGDNGLRGAAMPLNNPVYLAWAGHDRMVPIVASGKSLRAMHAFAQTSGGMLTDRQVESIVNGMISHWGKPGILNGANPPGYAATTLGDVAAGKAVFEIHCARCHGADGTGPTAGSKQGAVGSIVDPTYLSLISTQGLRDIVVSGLLGEGMPDWRGDQSAKPMPEKPMTDKEVTDVVAWLASHRVQFPGQPFPTAQR
jgi:mono/diheme cytochrome c family protein